MKILIIINDPPYGTEKAYNALRLAMHLQKENEETELCIFLMADAVACALPSQNTPAGYYNIERMLKSIISKHGEVRICRTCVESRGLMEVRRIENTTLSNMVELAYLVADYDKVMTF